MRRELEHFGKFVAMGIFVSFAALPLFALVVAVMPHCITEWPYVVFIVAFALLFAKSSIRRAFIADGLEAKVHPKSVEIQRTLAEIRKSVSNE